LADDFNPNSKPKKREKSIESYFMDKIKAIGGICYKFVSPGNSGVPDRVVLYKGCVVFVELKRPGQKPRKLQSLVIEDIKKQGVPAFAINSKEQIDSLIARLTVDGGRWERGEL
jgi:VRR-NUC domain.